MYRQLVTGISLTLIALGLVIFVVTASRGGGVGYLLGTLFVAAGVGRLYLLRRR